MKFDEGKRSQSGVVSSLVELNDDKLRLIFDDVKNISSNGRGPWEYHTLFTFNDYDKNKILSHELSESELAEIGFNLLVRLGVLHENPIK